VHGLLHAQALSEQSEALGAKMEQKATAMEQRNFEEVDQLHKLLEAGEAALQTEVAAAAAAHEAADAAANATKAAQARASLLEEKLSEQDSGASTGAFPYNP